MYARTVFISWEGCAANGDKAEECSGQREKTERGILAWEGSWQGKSHQAARGMLGWVNSPELFISLKSQLSLKQVFFGNEIDFF